ncbi:phosphoribosylamine--glycine ligase [bacterium]|nr:MAG: phosphoribosylamine--glycine ligase [bacterium]
MKILVIGNGGREHALVWKIAQSEKVTHIYCAAGNGGIRSLAECIPIKPTDINALLQFALQNKIDLTIVGPEQPLTLGIVDLFQQHELNIFGPSATAAEIEGSKVFAKNLMMKYGIPTAAFKSFTVIADAKAYITDMNQPCVVKADGLAAGKGAIVCPTLQEALTAVDTIKNELGEAGNSIVVEEMMEGEEASIFAVTDGINYLLLPAAQDHKRIFDGDRGKNTGGMGAYAPAPVMSSTLLDRVKKEIIEPTILAMTNEGRKYQGVLYCGIMLTRSGPKVVEFNCRFGDPECQAVLPLIKSDIVDMFLSVVNQSISSYRLDVRQQSSVCVVMASGGYPDQYEKNKEISGLDRMTDENTLIFHAGTDLINGKVCSSGGRVLGVTSCSEHLPDAIKKAYTAAEQIHFEKAYFRKDIGYRALKN